MKSHPLSSPTNANDGVRFEHVGLRYGRGEEILNDVSFYLPPGSLNFVTGPSGAGKTSLLKLIYLNMRPSRGLISVFDQDISQLELTAIPNLKRRMGVVLQDFRLIEHLNVFENTALPLRVLGAKRESYQNNVISLLRWVGLGDRMRALPQTLSAGEKQRAAIARAVVTKPEILIADEPTGNVDLEIGNRLIRLFTELNKQGTTVVIATHDLALIPEDANVISIKDGHLKMTLSGTSTGVSDD